MCPHSCAEGGRAIRAGRTPGTQALRQGHDRVFQELQGGPSVEREGRRGPWEKRSEELRGLIREGLPEPGFDLKWNWGPLQALDMMSVML